MMPNIYPSCGVVSSYRVEVQAKSNEILTAVVAGMRTEETVICELQRDI